MKRVLGYGRHSISENDIKAVCDVLRSDFLTQGPMVERFEAAIAERVGAKHAIAVNSGTAALHLACLAAGMTDSDCGITQAITFVASANAFRYCDSNVQIVDIDRETLGIDVPSLPRLLRKYNPKVVMPVLFGGLAHNSAKLREETAGRIIIEDGSHALGGLYEDGQQIGCCAFSDMTTFSFHPVKPLTTGEGGMIVTNDPEYASVLRLLRSHGIEKEANKFIDSNQSSFQPWYYEQQRLGFNFRMTDLQAALGLSQLSRLDEFLGRRKEIAEAYDSEFRNAEFVYPLQSKPDFRKRSAHHLYVIDVDFGNLNMNRTEFISELYNRGVGSQVHYIPLYQQPYYCDRFSEESVNCPNAKKYYEGCLSLPLHPGLSDEDVGAVISAVRSVANLKC